MSVLLKKSLIEGVSSKELVEQIEAKKRCQKKLPTWYKTPGIYYPKKINIEQTSSEKTAHYKAEIVTGKSLLDLTGGFGIDSYYFSHKIEQVSHCEIDQNLSTITSYNFAILDVKNIKCLPQDGIVFLKQSANHFDWIYVDPSRRNQKKGKVIQLEDYTPDVSKYLDFFFSKTNNILLKTSPLLDISAGLKTLNHVEEIHIVAVNNEVKELLWVLKNNFEGKVSIKTINFTKRGEEIFNFLLSEEKESDSSFKKPQSYLYEPNAALLKSGGFKIIGQAHNLAKLNKHTHLYTSNSLINFPGRRFKIEQIQKYSKTILKKLGIKKANITTRNFPDSVAVIRKKSGIKDGGDLFLFFFKNLEDENHFMICTKI